MFNDDYYKKVRDLNPHNIRFYLLSNGWVLSHTYPDESGSLWTKEGFQVRLIHNADMYDDYGDMMQKLVNTIAKAENLNPWNVVSLINSGNKDIIKVHISEPVSKDGTILLDKAIESISAIKNMIYSVAASTEYILQNTEPKISYPNRKTEQVTSYGQNIRMGQTEVGSYVLTLEMDVQPTCVEQTTLTDGGSCDSFERSVNLTMANALGALDESYKAKQDNPDSLDDIIKMTHRKGVSVNFCESLSVISKISEDIFSDLEFEFKWAAKYPVPKDTLENIKISATQIGYYSRVVKSYRERPLVFNQEFAGHVIKLNRDEGASEGEIVIKTNIDLKNKRLRIVLQNTDYDKAIIAHKSGCMLKCVGNLKTEGSIYELLEPHDVEILSGE